jgi:S-methylmethionine-dependent homocysteine/selenocysteine methylase
MKLKQLIENHPLILTEAAVVEALIHSRPEALHPELFNGIMIYDPEGRKALKALYKEFYTVAKQNCLPFVITAPTWRAGKERVEKAGVSKDINSDAVLFLKQVIQEIGDMDTISLGGLLGPKNDCYCPDLGLKREAAQEYHDWQARSLANAGPDFLVGATLPALDEALGMADAMAGTRTPYIISFVINRKGQLLDNTPLSTAFETIDQQTAFPPLGFMINCAHPSFLKPEQEPEYVLSRLIGIQANASALDHDQLDQAPAPKADDIKEWGDQMIRLNQDHNVQIMGGCCGTRRDHLAYIAQMAGMNCPGPALAGRSLITDAS